MHKYYIGFGLVLQTFAFLLATHASSAGQLPAALTQPYPYEASNMATRDLLDDFAARTGIAVISDDIAGRISVHNADGEARDFLDLVAVNADAVWWHDMSTVYVEPIQSVMRELVARRGVTLADLQNAMNFSAMNSGHSDTIEPSVKETPDGRFFQISGPASYVAKVERLMDEIRSSFQGPDGLPRVFRGGRGQIEVQGARAPAPQG